MLDVDAWKEFICTHMYMYRVKCYVGPNLLGRGIGVQGTHLSARRSFSFLLSTIISIRTPFYYLGPSFLSPYVLIVVVTQIRGHVAGYSPPLPTTGYFEVYTYVRVFEFYRDETEHFIQAFLASVDSKGLPVRMIIYTYDINTYPWVNTSTQTGTAAVIPATARYYRYYSSRSWLFYAHPGASLK